MAHITDLLTSNAHFKTMVMTAAQTPSGGLLLAGDLLKSLRGDTEPAARVLEKIAEALPPDSVVAKAYLKGDALKFIGATIHGFEGKAGLFGHGLPVGLSLALDKVKRGAGDKEYSVPIGRLTMPIKGDDGEDEVASLDFDFEKTGDDYHGWLKAALPATKAALLKSYVGEWKVPEIRVVSNLRRVELETIPPGVYQLTGVNSKQEPSKSGDMYTKWSLELRSADWEFATWHRILPRGMEVGIAQQVILESGGTLMLRVNGLRNQTDKSGATKWDSKNDRPYVELDGRIGVAAGVQTLATFNELMHADIKEGRLLPAGPTAVLAAAKTAQIVDEEEVVATFEYKSAETGFDEIPF